MKFGLQDSDLLYIKSVLKKFPEITDAIIFGSRAMGNFKVSSDIDICLKGNVSLETLGKIKSLLEESGPLPYLVDVVVYESIDSEELKKHIDTLGITLF